VPWCFLSNGKKHLPCSQKHIALSFEGQKHGTAPSVSVIWKDIKATKHAENIKHQLLHIAILRHKLNGAIERHQSAKCAEGCEGSP
jgi:hypothetical protein